ncbi:acyl transferase domain protein [Mycobacterium ulcerans str. Harvey]|uniref:Acyl transferase domain protein n=1 Tax=Mycobacterium ulcerans str. Harvey TaxID=1299332 RepID=A0ABN0R077_MYCUL|nr:acyl transferase domain protein [Mycobacterium ulcerans str. Harvey]
MWPTRSTITVPGRPGSAPWSPGNAPKRWPDYARWPPTNTPRRGQSSRRPPEPGTVFVYSGRGSQWAGMGRQLLADEPAFAAAVAELEPVFLAEAGFSLHDVLANGTELVGIEQIQLGLIGMQLTLTELWRSYGIQPDLVIGHSMGEVAAAVVAGALTPAEGLRVTAVRSRLMAPLSGQGGMALLGLDASRPRR